jgi:hypothetical protein
VCIEAVRNFGLYIFGFTSSGSSFASRSVWDWDLQCFDRLLFVLKANPHVSHGKGRSSECTCKCLASALGLVHTVLQYGHLCRHTPSREYSSVDITGAGIATSG